MRADTETQVRVNLKKCEEEISKFPNKIYNLK